MVHVRNRTAPRSEGVITDMPRHVPTLDSVILTANCRDVPWHVRYRTTLQTIDFEGGIGNISPGGRPLSNPQWDRLERPVPLGDIVQ